jgi:hypothetical protein
MPCERNQIAPMAVIKEELAQRELIASLQSVLEFLQPHASGSNDVNIRPP